MIKIIVKHSKEKQIKEIKVSGHAQSAVYGRDLVCAAVSSAAVGIANALVEYDFLKNNMGTIDLKEGYLQIKVDNSNEKIQVVLETFVTILTTIEISYSKYIKITKMEE